MGSFYKGISFYFKQFMDSFKKLKKQNLQEEFKKNLKKKILQEIHIICAVCKTLSENFYLIAKTAN